MFFLIQKKLKLLYILQMLSVSEDSFLRVWHLNESAEKCTVILCFFDFVISYLNSFILQYNFWRPNNPTLCLVRLVVSKSSSWCIIFLLCFLLATFLFSMLDFKVYAFFKGLLVTLKNNKVAKLSSFHCLKNLCSTSCLCEISLLI